MAWPYTLPWELIAKVVPPFPTRTFPVPTIGTISICGSASFIHTACPQLATVYNQLPSSHCTVKSLQNISYDISPELGQLISEVCIGFPET
jgi:hypothetical protein